MVTLRFGRAKQNLNDADKLRRVIPDICILEKNGLLSKRGYSSIRNGGVKLDKKKGKLTITYLDANSPIICKPGYGNQDCFDVNVNVVRPRKPVFSEVTLPPLSSNPISELPKSSSIKIQPIKPEPSVPKSSNTLVKPESSAKP